MTEAEFLAAFENCTLTRAEWTHAAHIRMGWLACAGGDSLENVLARVRAGIQRFNLTALNNPDGYHETITYAFLRLIWDRRREAAGEDFVAFSERNPELFSSRLLESYYSRDVLMSALARVEIVAPDLQPLPEV